MTIYQVALRFGVGSDDFFNVFHYDITGDDPLDLQDLTDELVASWVANAAPVIANAVKFRDVTYRLDIEGSVGATYAPTLGIQSGSSTDNQFAGQLAVLVQKRTNGVVRPNLGRVFVAGVTSEGLDAGGEWTAAVTTACESWIDDIIIVPFTGNGQAEMLLKANNPTAPNTNPYNSVAESVALSIPSVLQSRKKGRGA